MDALKRLRYYIIGGQYAVDRILQDEGMMSRTALMDADILVFTGGPDVSPMLYGEKAHPRTYTNPKRDMWEAACFARGLQEQGKIFVGICRGAQLLNVLNGGKLWQHVDGHGLHGTHEMRYEFKCGDGHKATRVCQVTSTHHQMMLPNTRGTGCEVWGRAGESTYKEGDLLPSGKRVRLDPIKGHLTDAEILWYPKTRSLCFQPHPEYMHKETRQLFFECLERSVIELTA